MASREKEIQDAVLGVLGGNPTALKIDTRTVALMRLLPEQAFQQRQLPAVVVERPRQGEVESFDNRSDRETFVSTVWLVDHYKPTPEGEQEGIEHLDQLRVKVEARLWAVPYLTLERYAVMPGFWTFTRAGEPETAGNNMMRVECRLEVPLIIRKRA